MKIIDFKDKILNMTSLAAVHCFLNIGKFSSSELDGIAVEIMRKALNDLDISGCIAIGEGERDEAPMLYQGEQVGKGGIGIDIGVDPLECTDACYANKDNSMSVIVISEENGIIKAPDVYMEKLSTAIYLEDGVLDIRDDIELNIKRFADFLSVKISDVEVVMLNRQRHQAMMDRVRKIGAKVVLIEDGDIMGIISTNSFFLNKKARFYYGIGGAPEGVIVSSVINNIGGFFHGRFVSFNEIQKDKMRSFDISSNKVYHNYDLVTKDSFFIASSITGGILDRVKEQEDGSYIVDSLIVDKTNLLQRVSVNVIL